MNGLRIGKVVDTREKLICVTVQTTYSDEVREKSVIESASNVVKRTMMTTMIGSRRPNAMMTMNFLRNLVWSRDTSRTAHANRATSSTMSSMPTARSRLYTPSQAPDERDHGTCKSHCNARVKMEAMIQRAVQIRNT